MQSCETKSISNGHKMPKVRSSRPRKIGGKISRLLILLMESHKATWRGFRILIPLIVWSAGPARSASRSIDGFGLMKLLICISLAPYSIFFRDRSCPGLPIQTQTKYFEHSDNVNLFIDPTDLATL